MENYSEQHLPMHPTPPISDDASSPPEIRKVAIESVSQLVEDYPLLFWAGIWLSVLLVAAIAVSGLVSPGLPGRRASSASFGSSSGTEQVQTARRSNRLPFWLFGALAFTCTAGSFLVSQRASHIERTQKLSRPRGASSRRAANAARYFTVENRSHRPHSRRSGKRLKPFPDGEWSTLLATPPASYPHAPLPGSGSPNRRLKPKRRPQRSLSREGTAIPVTVIPPEQNHPLDWDAPSLADLMDIRKQRSPSSWM